MKFGTLEFQPVDAGLDLVGEPTKQAILTNKLQGILVSEIDPNLSDTTAFCEQYQVSTSDGANCVIVEAKRSDKVWYAACLIQGTKRIDVNGIVRRELDAKKISFAPMDRAVSLSKMEYGAINPIGLPPDWPILVDQDVAKLDHAIIGSGIRKSKLLVTGELLASLPNAKVMDLAKQN
ncbi:YbaK/EbsC family protein [Candidatus Saccharibacteria bacterium]|nr:YbaK/EbsC family protein [Candidatus Saccharibacteria bacterium]